MGLENIISDFAPLSVSESGSTLDQATMLYNEALECAKAGQLREARATLKNATRMYPQFDDAYVLMGLCVYADGNRIDGMKIFNQIENDEKHSLAMAYCDRLSENHTEKVKTEPVRTTARRTPVPDDRYEITEFDTKKEEPVKAEEEEIPSFRRASQISYADRFDMAKAAVDKKTNNVYGYSTNIQTNNAAAANRNNDGKPVQSQQNPRNPETQEKTQASKNDDYGFSDDSIVETVTVRKPAKKETVSLHTVDIEAIEGKNEIPAGKSQKNDSALEKRSNVPSEKTENASKPKPYGGNLQKKQPEDKNTPTGKTASAASRGENGTKENNAAAAGKENPKQPDANTDRQKRIEQNKRKNKQLVLILIIIICLFILSLLAWASTALSTPKKAATDTQTSSQVQIEKNS